VAIKEYFPRELVGRSEGDPLVRAHGARESAQFEFGKLRFLEEGRTLAAIEHPRVVRILELFEEHRTAYLVMEYHRGATLAEVAAFADVAASAGGRLSPALVVALALEILDGLETVHGQGVLHCDIKPSNLYLTATGRPLLLDFGAARRDFGERTATLDGVLSPGFAPFELFQERGRLGPWTDVYGVAATAVALLTGERPPSAADRVANDPLAPGSALAGSLPPELRAPLLAALALYPEGRTANARSFAAALRAAPIEPAPESELAAVAAAATARRNLDGDVATGSSTTTLSRPSGRRRSRTGRPFRRAAAIALVLGVAFVVGWTLRERPRDRAALAPEAKSSEASSAAPAARAAPGEVLFAVVPFAELVALRDAQGREPWTFDAVPLPATLALPPGDWSAVVRNPVTGETALLPLRVAPGTPLRVTHRFARLEARDYFGSTGW